MKNDPMNVADYRAYKLSNPNESDELERDICAALRNRTNEADICEKYSVGRSVLVVIKEDNGLIFKGPLAGASAETIAARKLYERQCHAKGENPATVKEWRVMFETKEVVVRGEFKPEDLEQDEPAASAEKMAKVHKGEQLPLDFEKEPRGLFEHGSPKHLEIIRYNLNVDFLQMLCNNPRFVVCLNSLADELANGNSGKLILEYKSGRTTNLKIEYKDE